VHVRDIALVTGCRTRRHADGPTRDRSDGEYLANHAPPTLPLPSPAPRCAGDLDKSISIVVQATRPGRPTAVRERVAGVRPGPSGAWTTSSRRSDAEHVAIWSVEVVSMLPNGGVAVVYLAQDLRLEDFVSRSGPMTTTKPIPNLPPGFDFTDPDIH